MCICAKAGYVWWLFRPVDGIIGGFLCVSAFVCVCVCVCGWQKCMNMAHLQNIVNELNSYSQVRMAEWSKAFVMLTNFRG